MSERGYWRCGQWIEGDEWNVVSAHWFRQCHPETCSCSTDFVVTKNGFHFMDVESVSEGWDIVKEKRRRQGHV